MAHESAARLARGELGVLDYASPCDFTRSLLDDWARTPRDRDFESGPEQGVQIPRRNPSVEKTLPEDFEREIERSRAILELEDDFDDEGSVRYDLSTWSRAIEFVKNIVRRKGGAGIPVPHIDAGPDGSIDVHWKAAGVELLVNVPPDRDAPASFYGDAYHRADMRGKLETDSAGAQLILDLIQLWQTTGR